MVEQYLRKEIKLIELKPALADARKAAQELEENPTVQVAARAVATACAVIVRARPCFGYGVFRVPKNEIPKTNKPPAMRVVGIALAYSKKPPMVQ